MHHTLDAKMRILMLSLLELFQEGKNMLWQLFYNREHGKNSFRIVTWRWFHTRTKDWSVLKRYVDLMHTLNHGLKRQI